MSVRQHPSPPAAPVPALPASGAGVSEPKPVRAEPGCAAGANRCLSPALAVSTELSQGCARGCDLCSEFNGCLRCSPKLFILLERNDIRQIGICLPSCPLGYFGLRNTDMNKCISEYGVGGKGRNVAGGGALQCFAGDRAASSQGRLYGCIEGEEVVLSRAAIYPGNNPIICADVG